MNFSTMVINIALTAYLSDHPHAQIGKIIRENRDTLILEDKRLVNKLYKMKPKKRVQWVRYELVPRILELNLDRNVR